MAKWWSDRVTKKQRSTYYTIDLLLYFGVLLSLITAAFTADDKLFSGVFFFFTGIYCIMQGVYAGFHLKEFPKIFPSIVKITELSAELKGIMLILLGIVAIYVSFRLII